MVKYIGGRESRQHFIATQAGFHSSNFQRFPEEVITEVATVEKLDTL